MCVCFSLVVVVCVCVFDSGVVCVFMCVGLCVFCMLVCFFLQVLGMIYLCLEPASLHLCLESFFPA